MPDQPDRIVELVKAKFDLRSTVGIRKYGVTLERTDLTERDWLLHLQEEMMDSVLYIEKLLSQKV